MNAARRGRATWRRIGAVTLLLAAVTAAPAAAQADAAVQDPVRPAGAPVVLRGDTLWVIHTSLGPFTPEQRAAAAVERLVRLARDRSADSDSLYVVDDGTTSSVLLGEAVVATVTEAEALAAGKSRAELAAEVVTVVRRVLHRESVSGIVRVLLLGALQALLATLVLIVALRILHRLVPRLQARLEQLRGTRIPSIRIQRLELLSAARVTNLLKAGVRAVRLAIVVILLLWYVPLVFNFFPWTEPYADRFFEWILNPLRQVWSAVLDYIPNLFYIAVIVAVTHYLLRFIRLFFDGMTRGTLVLPGFYPEWALPTFKIVRFLVLAFALIVIFPYLPGAGSDAFKGVSVFFGILLSLGSAGAIGNMVAGLVITYMRPFSLGDRVKISDTMGDVIERTLLVTRVRTPKHVEVSVPNAMVLSSHIINYSAAARDGGVILHTGVTIGYDTPWRQVHELLLEAASRTDGLLEEPKPFVLQTALSDFYVAYEVNAYTEQAHRMPGIYSELHQHIQDVFREAGVQIMSPNYEADPAEPKIPPADVPKKKPGPS
jgi:small-conductance mechanosensitive channel